MLQVRLDIEDLILGYVSGKIRRSFYRYYQEIQLKLKQVVKPGDAQFIDSATRIRRIN
uniref:Translational initiation factor 1 n=1 Tax=Leptodermis oblonga TaxID=1616479 RepID=A0A894JKX6_9GENT|nr:translational initiation factor 1 [Leptodermis oblonga]QRV60474.1 translational initiation factor 1 [Leptodermis oblonga]